MLKIRLRRMGKRHRPFYRVVVSDSRDVPTAPAVEELGHYDPLQTPPEIRIDVDRIHHWVGQGAQMSATIKKLVKGYTPVPSDNGEKAAAPAPAAAEKAPKKEAKKAPEPAPEATEEETAEEASEQEASAAEESTEEAAPEAAAEPEATAETPEASASDDEEKS